MSTDSFDCRITCNNLTFRAMKRISYGKPQKHFRRNGFAADIAVDIEKHVPLMGGMGGSSVDGAGTLSH